MLRGRVLDEEATLNSYELIGSLDIIPGSAFTLNFQTYQPQNKDKLRYFAEDAATMVAHLPKSDGTTLDVTMTNIGDDRSLWTGDVSSADSEDLIGGNFTFTLTEGAEDTLGIVELGLSVILTGSCC